MIGTLLVALTVAVSFGAARPAAASAARAARSARRRNIVFVLADDLDVAEMSYMPEVQALIGNKGVTFDRYFVSDSLCCPSRTTMLRGQYAHNTGVLSNGGTNGGFERAYANGVEADTFATRLQAAGYRTGLFGKYLNHYPGSAGTDYIPPGWSVWASPVQGHPYSEYDYVLNQNRDLVPHGYDPTDYGTDVYMGLAQRFIEGSVSARKPFFAFVSVYAPHTPSTPAPADVNRFAGAHAPRTPSYDQADVSAMPSYIRVLPQFTPEEASAIDRLYERRIESLQAVDRGVADLVATLKRTHQLANTFIVFASDNGFHLGQHRLPAGKETPYDTDIHVPLLMRGPGIRARSHVGQLALNTDLAPTFEAMAHVKPARFTDGRSLLPLARGRTGPQAKKRTAILVEHFAATRTSTPARHLPRGIVEPEDPDEFDPALHPTAIRGRDPLRDKTVLARLIRIPDYAAVRTGRYLYVEYADGGRELYDVRADPDEVHNLAGQNPALEERLAARLDALRACRAHACRAAENGRSLPARVAAAPPRHGTTS